MPAKTGKSIVSYRELSAQLDEVLAKLQDPDLDVDVAAQAYEEGLKLVARLEKHLEQAETKIQTIRAQNDGASVAK
jgi:exodeoxyribonuclease VII small subunit